MFIVLLVLSHSYVTLSIPLNKSEMQKSVATTDAPQFIYQYRTTPAFIGHEDHSSDSRIRENVGKFHVPELISAKMDETLNQDVEKLKLEMNNNGIGGVSDIVSKRDAVGHSSFDNNQRNRFRRSANPRLDLPIDGLSGFNYWPKNDCDPECPQNDEWIDENDSLQILKEMILQATENGMVSPLTSWTMKNNNNVNKLESLDYPGGNIWKNLNLSGQRENPLYAEEPHYVLVRREEDSDPKMGKEMYIKSNNRKRTKFHGKVNSLEISGPDDYSDDPFIPPRGRKHMPLLKELLDHYELFVPNRGKKDDLGDIFKYDDLFFPNRGKRHTDTQPARIDSKLSAAAIKKRSTDSDFFTYNRRPSKIGSSDQYRHQTEHDLRIPNDGDQSGHKETSSRQRLDEANLSLDGVEVKRRKQLERRQLERRRYLEANEQGQDERWEPGQRQGTFSPSLLLSPLSLLGADIQGNREKTFYTARQRGRRSTSNSFQYPSGI